MDYSKTVNLPQTDFSMKANLTNREPEMLKKWEKEKIYHKILKEKEGHDLFLLHDGPPYANGHIHLGHALNKILKDIIIKHKSLQGYQTPYVPGWDCHGLPIELSVSKSLGKKVKEMSKEEIRQKCREYAKKHIEIQKEEFKRLGIFADFENPYLTMSKEYEAKIIEIFGDIFSKGYIARNKKPIYWCPTCVTALAEAEVEYAQHSSPSIYVKFKISPESLKEKELSENSFVVIWTTTPWTLPANLGVCFHPQFKYSFYKFKDEYYLLADDLLSQFEAKTGLKNEKRISLSSEEIANLKVNHPFIERESKVIFGRHVTLEQGTGIVHTAPGHGLEDYQVGLEYNLETYCPVNSYGCFTNDFSEMEGENVFKANPLVVDLLKEKQALIFKDNLEHSYPHCWRCHKPLIYRATEQWFLMIDHNNLRDQGLKAVEQTNWIPSCGENRIKAMVENRPDWCLSRQRTWGVPIPSFRCQACEKNLMSSESVAFFAKIAKEKGIDSWYSEELIDLIPKGTKCSCGSSDFIKEFDILDVWFDSGVSSFAVLDERKNHTWPADLYLEGSDQHRGWFQSSLWPSLSLRGQAPFKSVLTHGFVLDEQGKAMSKSQGNVIPPEKIINQFGADILRLWVSSEDYRNDLRIGFDMIKQNADSYRKIRNTFKFILGNLLDFSSQDQVAYKNLQEVDQWILHKLFNLSQEVINHYDNFEFHLVNRKIVNFCSVELSSIYFDISKDILYVEEKKSLKRRATQTVLKEIFNCLVKLIAPILVFTSEEIWSYEDSSNSIHSQKYYDLDQNFYNPSLGEKLEKIVTIKKDILKVLEKKRKEKVINSSLEAEVTLFLTDEKTRDLLKEMGDEIKRFFQVAKIIFSEEKMSEGEESGHSFILITKTSGIKCDRCWNYFESDQTETKENQICERCSKILKTLPV